jgi:pimeloyl-ACP methyl ester carboxylesterase
LFSPAIRDSQGVKSTPVNRVIGVVVLMVVAVVCAPAVDNPPPTGQLVDIGGRKLHIHCTGTGNPTVIVENGGAAFSFDWELVQPEVARFTRICTYDRAGYAWSDVGPEFDSFNQAGHDLHLLLMKARIPGPYVLVGHSLGGLLVRNYQAAYPTDVVGIVLVDSSHEDSLQPVGLKVVRIPELTATQFKDLIDQGKAKRSQNPEQDLVPTRIFPPYDRLPTQFQTLHLWALGKVLPLVRTWGLNMHADFGHLHQMRVASPQPLGNMPLAVLTASEFDVTQDSGMTPAQGKQDHLRLQSDLVHLSTNSKQVMVSGTGHEIYLFQPAIVVRSISAVVTSVHNHSPLPPIE